ncbi:hypothetical protein WMF28_27770 [Sorangium sp. So ce590]|uniref:hypothetical protein n=1 Tax=Sorangium sp. So ce590 TaxID=3133317 RepID=UPI003F5DCC72
MRKLSFPSSACLLLVLSGCVTEGVEPTTAAPDDPIVASGAPATEIVASGAFATDADRERFEAEVLPSARAFLSYWAEVGLAVPHEPARLFISPPPGMKASEALPELYGESIFDDLRALEVDVANAASNRAALDLIDAFTCAHPPLDRGFLEDAEKYVDDPDIRPADFAEALREYHDERMAPDATFSFHADNGEFELPARRNCSYVLLGHSTEPTRAHPYLERDVVNHELGHALHYGLWMASGPLGERLSASANEAIADILAHVFDGDACHGKVLDERGAPVGCRRRMDVYESSVSDAVWERGRGDHETGQALRQLVWTLRGEVTADALRAAIRDGVAAVQVALNEIDEEPLSNVPVFDDEILAMRYRFVREYEATSAFFNAVCGSLGHAPRACDEHQERLGDPRLAMREAWLANAPTAIGPRGVTLTDGRRVAFEIEGALIQNMTVTLADGEGEVYPGDPDLGIPEEEREPSSGRVTLWFSAPGSASPGAQVGWTSDGALTAR